MKFKTLKLEDQKTHIPTPFIGFSIKSQLSGAATLLNATAATNFKYEIVSNRKAVQGPMKRQDEAFEGL